MASKSFRRGYIRKILNEATDPKTNTQNPNVFVKAPTSGIFKDMPDIYIFDPIGQSKMDLRCRKTDKRHENSKIVLTRSWTDFGRFSPRIIYGIEKNIYLVSRVYFCPVCKKTIRAISPYFVRQLPMTLVNDFILYHDSALTSTLYNLIINQVARGTTFAGIAKTFREVRKIHFAQHLSVEERSVRQVMDFDTYRCISASHIADIFLHWFRLHQAVLIDEFKSIKCQELSIDHTFYGLIFP